MKKLLLLIVIVLRVLLVFGQTDPLYYLNESFETQDSRTKWTSYPVDPQVKWSYKNGGVNSTPTSAFDGDTNAILQWSDFDMFTRTLISPPIDLKDAVKPVLSFVHAQYPFLFGQDELRLLFKAGLTGTWDTIMVRTDPVEKWDELFLNIQEIGSKYLVENFFLGFCGKTNSGNGVCIDKVVIEEKGFISKYIRKSRIENVPHGIIPSGVKNIPLMKIFLEVFGTVDSMKLNSISFKSVSSDNNVFESNGFRLYATTGTEFRINEKGQSTLITPSVSINADMITFSGINYWLKTGQNTIWLTADIKPDRFTHGNSIDFKLMQNSISINDTLLPRTETNPAGIHTIEESVLFDDFESGGNFSLNPDFEIDIPRGLIIGYTRDPGYAYSGGKSLGTDLTQNGAYLMNINSANAYFATTSSVNMKYFIGAKLHMKTWNGFDALDNATIDVSVDNGVTWNSIWVNTLDGLQAESKWNDLLFTDKFDALVRRKENVKVRFAMNYSDNQFALSGWNIDNFAITGNHLETDVGITDVLAPYNDCFGSNNDTVKITVKNHAAVPTPATIPVYFALQGKSGVRVYDTIPGPIDPGESVLFTFTRVANFPGAGNYDKFMVSLNVEGDEDSTNDAIHKPIYIQQTIIPPSTEKFELNEGFWRAGVNSGWECMRPDGSIPVIPQSPVSWMESPYGGYANNDTSYVVSSCYDLRQNPDLIIELKLWMETDEGKDGMNIQYTADNGQTWHIINNTPYGINWGWFTEPVEALGAKGWTRNTVGWKVVRDFLPVSLLSQKKVQFRAYWRSDASINARGAAFDDFKIFPAPPDIGVTQIEAFGNACQFNIPKQVSVTIRNLGNVTMKRNDTIVAGYSLDQNQLAVDTFLLTSDLIPGQTIQHTFSTPGVFDPGNHMLKAYTLIEDDPWFYGPNNDTSIINFEVYPGPFSNLPDTIQTKVPDTVVIRPFYDPDYDYLWHDMSTEREFHVQHQGWHKLLVTDARGNGCTVKDSTYIELLFYDVGAESLVYPVNHCGLSRQEYITVRARNYGTDSIAAGQRIAVLFEMNGGPPVSESFQLTRTLYSKHAIDFTFDRGALDLSGKGIYNFKIYTSYGGDTIAINDTIFTSVEILGRPAVSLGPDITVEALAHTLNAGTGYESYEWDNGITTQTREITESGSYWVRVFDGNQCDNYDTAIIRLKIRDISSGALESPLSDCSFDSEAQVSFRIVNSGNDTVPPGSTIVVSYRFQNNGRIGAVITLSQQLIPGASIVHTFGSNVDLGSPGNYSLEYTAVIAGDLRAGNDTSVATIYRYPKPVVDFGLESTEYIEDISLQLDAGYSPFYSYQWQDTTTTHLYTVTSSGLYHARATDLRTQCFDRDTVMIFLIYGDVGVTWSDMPSTGCSGTSNKVSVKVTNLGPSAIGGSAPIYIACDVNGNKVTIDTLIRAGNFNPGAILELELSESILLANEGLSRVDLYTVYDEDKKTENDTLSVSFTSLPGPVIDFGDINGALNVELPHELNAGEGYKSYLWQDNSTGKTYNVNEKGIYSVTVTGQNDCRSSKTVWINMPVSTDYSGPETGRISIYPNPGNGLFHVSVDDGSDHQIVRIFNNNGQILYLREFRSHQLSDEMIDVQHLPRGIYHLVITSDTKNYQGKIVIQ